MINKIIYFCFLKKILFLFLSMHLISPSLLNRIIRIAENNYRYIHFSYFSNGDMIIDSSAYPISNGRIFFGLKENGSFYFDNGETGHCIITVDHSFGRIEGESYAIKINSTNSEYDGKELILGISKAVDETHYAEVYNLDDKNMMAKYLINDIFGNIYSDCFSIEKSPDETGDVYTIAYVIKQTDKYYINIKKTYFSFESTLTYNNIKDHPIRTGDQKTLSCFYIKSLYYLCYYLSLEGVNLRIRIYPPDFSNDDLKTNVYDAPSTYTSSTFFKGIYLKDDIGVFAFYKINNNFPTISILKYDNQAMVPYNGFTDIDINKEIDFNKDVNLNDMIKLNDFQICFFGVNTGRTQFKIVVLTLYKNDSLMNIRYYNIEMWNHYAIKIFLNIKANLYKNFIALSFSHCPPTATACNSLFSDHYTSFIIFNYASSTNNSLDIISCLYNSDKKIENGIEINFEEKLVFENNLFNYILKGTKIMNCPTGIYLKNMTNGNIIDGTIILKNKYALLYFDGNGNYPQKIYSIIYAYVLEEDDYENLDNNINMTNSDYIRGNSIDPEKNYYIKNEYVGKSSYFDIIISEDLISDCNNQLCDLCFRNYTCITCKYNSTFKGNVKECIKPYIPTTIPEIPSTILEAPSTIPKITNLPTQDYDCTEEEVLAKKCNGKMTNEQIGIIYKIMQQRVSANASEIIETQNVKFQISTLEEQKNNHPNISVIDLNECEDLLKAQEGLTEDQELIVLKTDIKSDDLSTTYVQYEIYSPKTLTVVSLEICQNVSISVSVPVSLDENTKAMYNSLSKSGYNLYNINDSFYNDICTTYTTENGTDLTLADRKNLIYDKKSNVTMCQDDCTFEFYNLTTQRAQCDCSIQIKETVTDVNKIKFDKNEFVDNFFSTLKNSNFLVLLCYKLVFSLKGQTNNIGSYLMSGITFIFIVLLFIYIFNGDKNLSLFIKTILKQKLFSKINKKGSEKLKSIKKPKMNQIKIKKNKNKNGINNKIKQKNSKEKNIKKSEQKELLEKGRNKMLKKKSGKKLKNFPPKKKSKKTRNNITINKKLSDNLSKELLKNKNNIIKIKIKNKNIFNISNNIKTLRQKSTLKSIESNKKLLKNLLENPNFKKLNDEELNSLEYELAIILDKRAYFQYYFSLLKKKQLILFAFLPSNDFNLVPIKISLLLLAFSLFATINGFFFSDSTMNKINEDKGAFNIILQIPQILYSTIISAIINIILKLLSLSERQILIIKSEKDFLIAKKKSKSIKRCLRIKLSIFFVISFILMLFFWYFISCFCAVYKNTQMILINDTLLSFGLSMLYPFGLNLLPGMFRIPSLRAAKKDKKCLYKLAGFIALI